MQLRRSSPSVRSWVVLSSLAALAASCEQPAALPDRTPPSWVADTTSTLSTEQRQRIDGQSDRLFALRSIRLGVAVIRSTNHSTVERVGDDLYHRWRMHELRDGSAVLLVVATEDRKNRIVVGRALFREVSDQHASAILAEVFRPRARNAGVAIATLETVDRIIEDLEHPRFRPPPPRDDRPAFLWWRALLGIAAAIAVARSVGAIVALANRNRTALTVEWPGLIGPALLVMLVTAWLPAAWGVATWWPLHVAVITVVLSSIIGVVLTRSIGAKHVARAIEAEEERAELAALWTRAIEAGLVADAEKLPKPPRYVFKEDVRPAETTDIDADFASYRAMRSASSASTLRHAFDALLTTLTDHAARFNQELAETASTLRSIRARHAKLRATIKGLSAPLEVEPDGLTREERAAVDALPKGALTGRALFDAMSAARALVARCRASGEDCELFDKRVASATTLRESLPKELGRTRMQIDAARTIRDQLAPSLSKTTLDEFAIALSTATGLVDEVSRWFVAYVHRAPVSMTEAIEQETELREQDERLRRACVALHPIEHAQSTNTSYSGESSSYGSTYGDSGSSSSSYGDSGSSGSSYDSYSSGGGGGSDTSGGSGDW